MPYSKTARVFNNSTRTVIIDPGHGYPDGGAVAPDGTVESDINLLISLNIKEYLEKAGLRCIMTRTDANSIFSDGNTIHQKKVSDIRNRIKIANADSTALMLSIHLNTFNSPLVSGAQVFYSKKSLLAKNVSEEIQNSINTLLQPHNPKSIKPISSNIYLFNHIKNDSILVECGFLTNPEELSKLKNKEYQNKIASVISEAIIYKLSGSDKNAT